MSDETESPKGELQLEVNVRRFFLRRDTDHTGVSGTGIVAEGVEFSSGKVVITWRSHMGTVTVMDSLKVLQATSVHKGQTKIVWLDKPPFDSEDSTDE